MSSSITTGAGRDRLQGKLQVIDVSPVGLAGALERSRPGSSSGGAPTGGRGTSPTPPTGGPPSRWWWTSTTTRPTSTRRCRPTWRLAARPSPGKRGCPAASSTRPPGAPGWCSASNQPVIDRQLMVAACRGAGAIVERALIQLDLVAFRVAQDSLCRPRPDPMGPAGRRGRGGARRQRGPDGLRGHAAVRPGGSVAAGAPGATQRRLRGPGRPGGRGGALQRHPPGGVAPSRQPLPGLPGGDRLRRHAGRPGPVGVLWTVPTGVAARRAPSAGWGTRWTSRPGGRAAAAWGSWTARATWRPPSPPGSM